MFRATGILPVFFCIMSVPPMALHSHAPVHAPKPSGKMPKPREDVLSQSLEHVSLSFRLRYRFTTSMVPASPRPCTEASYMHSASTAGYW